ncbi:MAG: hypothetical protein U0905_16775 [Pirellulales bacterium]
MFAPQKKTDATYRVAEIGRETLRNHIPVLLGVLPDVAQRTKKFHRFIIAISIWTIAAVAAYDLFLTIKYAASLDMYEQNPIGRAIMRLNSGQVHDLEPVALFSSCKFLGTLVVVMILQGLSLIKRDWAVIASVAVATFQIFLLTFFLL